MGEIMEKPIKMRWFGVPLFSEKHPYISGEGGVTLGGGVGFSDQFMTLFSGFGVLKMTPVLRGQDT